MFEDEKKVIYAYERKADVEQPLTFHDFHEVVHLILIACWTKSSTPLHCLVRSLNPRLFNGLNALLALYVCCRSNFSPLTKKNAILTP